MLEEIKEIIEECESVQESQESAYTKEQAKLSAYARIKEMAIQALEREPKPCDTCRHYENGCHWLPSVTPLEQEPCVTMKKLSDEEIKHFAEEMKKARPQVISQDLVKVSQAISQESCEDAVSRQAVCDAIYDYSMACDVNYAQIMEYIDKLPSVNPQKPKTDVLNKIIAEIGQMDFDFGGFYDHTNTIREMVLEVIDKYKEESEG